MLSLQKINAAIKKLGWNATLYKGTGYFYFMGDDIDISYPGVYVYKVNDLCMDEWLEEFYSRVKFLE